MQIMSELTCGVKKLLGLDNNGCLESNFAMTGQFVGAAPNSHVACASKRASMDERDGRDCGRLVDRELMMVTRNGDISLLFIN